VRAADNRDAAASRSKIGRLPFAMRNSVCEMLDGGASAGQVCRFVNGSDAFKALARETGCGPVTPQNVTDWRKSGFARWLDERRRTERLRALAESSFHIAAATGGDPAAVGARILAGRLMDILENIEDDAQAVQLAGALASLRKGENDAAKLELDRRREELRRESLELEKEKFRWQAASTALKLFEDARARAVAEGPGTNEEKIRALIAYMDEQEGGVE